MYSYSEAAKAASSVLPPLAGTLDGNPWPGRAAWRLEAVIIITIRWLAPSTLWSHHLCLLSNLAWGRWALLAIPKHLDIDCISLQDSLLVGKSWRSTWESCVATTRLSISQNAQPRCQTINARFLGQPQTRVPECLLATPCTWDCESLPGGPSGAPYFFTQM